MNFSQYQYDDLQAKGADWYAMTKYEIIKDWLRGRQQLKILNAGCGSGELSFLLARAGHTVMGIDPVPEYIALARSQLSPDLTSHCAFAVSAIEDFVAAKPFDAVVATDVLEHIADDQMAWTKLVSLVRPGGLIILTVPALSWLFGYHDEALGHYRRYTKRSLAELMRSSGQVETEKMRYFGFALLPIGLWYSRLWRRPYPVAAKSKMGRVLRKAMLAPLLTVEKLIPMPLGTCLIAYGVKR